MSGRNGRESTKSVSRKSAWQPLGTLLGAPMEPGRFLPLAERIAAALAEPHGRGAMHGNISPRSILVHLPTDDVTITISPAGTKSLKGEDDLAYISPEQTGRMNRTVDHRSELYSLGVVLYQMLTGMLPHQGEDVLGWVHCHIARSPVPPGERVPGIPPMVSRIVTKLLAKNAEDRYQTASGLVHDLELCLRQWESGGRIEAFPPGERDFSECLLIPRKLYGREGDIDTLLDAFERVVASGKPEMVMVAGYSGIGKTSLARELDKPVARERGVFISGKFDQFKRDIPYATIIDAFRELVQQILGESEEMVAEWKRRLQEALGVNGRLITNVFPQVELIIGPQPPVADLPPAETRNRFNMLFMNFIGVFARKEHPLVLFLDDLQWVDPASLKLVENIVSDRETRHLLLVGAYRDNKMGPAHPLLSALEDIRKSGAILHTVTLAPLSRDDVGRLTAEALHSDPGRVAPLSRLVFEKTRGNPFFVLQFLDALHREDLLAFDAARLAWTWDMDGIEAKGFTDNVVELMVEKLKRLPEETQRALKLAGCLGSEFDLKSLAIIGDRSEEEMEAALEAGVREGLVVLSRDNYVFLHDRVQEAAYALIPPEQRPEVRLRIGRLLLSHMGAAVEEKIFDIANHLNIGAFLITEQREKDSLAELNLVAGRRAKAAAAYQSAASYLADGMAVLAADSWRLRYGLSFALHIERAQCEWISGRFEIATDLLEVLMTHAGSRVDQLEVYRIKVSLHTTRGEVEQAILTALAACAKIFDIVFPLHPTRESLKQAAEDAWREMEGRSIEHLLNLPSMADPERKAEVALFSASLPAAYFTDPMLHDLLCCRIVSMSIRYGNSDFSPHGYVNFGATLGRLSGKWEEAFRFGKVARDLVEQGFIQGKPSTYYTLAAFIIGWVRHLREALALFRQSFQSSMESGDMNHASFASLAIVACRLIKGDSLVEVAAEAERQLDFTRQAKNEAIHDAILDIHRLVQALRGVPSHDSPGCGENAFPTAGAHPWRIFSFHTFRAFAGVVSGDYAAVAEFSVKADNFIPTGAGHIQFAVYFHAAALALAARHEQAPPDQRQAYLQMLAVYQEQFESWQKHCPENFRNQYALIRAEVARIQGRDLEAMRFYEEAIRSARDNGFVQNEALGCEFAARFHRKLGFEINADAYLRKARACYVRWGAAGKVKQLDELYPWLRDEERTATTNGAGAQIGRLDALTVSRASQAISGEIVLSSLLDKLMRIAVENAGARKGFLLIPRGEGHEIAAKALVEGEEIKVLLDDQSPLSELPLSVINFVGRTRESVILDDTTAPNMFSSDDYIIRNRGGSLLCLPIVRQGNLTGLLYLENDLVKGAFTPERIAVLEVLAAQAAISLENSRLYVRLHESEHRFRAIFDQTFQFIGLMTTDGTLVEVNRSALEFAGISEADVLNRPFEDAPWWKHSRELRKHLHSAIEKAARGEFVRFEATHPAPDGSLHYVDFSIKPVMNDAGEVVLLIPEGRDITERKESEEEIRRLNAELKQKIVQLVEAQEELVRKEKLSILGQLSGSVGHELRNPLGVMSNAVYFLKMVLADADETVTEYLEIITKEIDNSQRIITDLLDFARTKTPRTKMVTARELLNESLGKSAFPEEVEPHVEIPETLPPLKVDPLQMGQVFQNLITNAVQAMPRGGALRVAARRVSPDAGSGPCACHLEGAQGGAPLQGFVEISVEDTGEGISPENMKNLFQPLFTTKARGIGLGLTVCKNLTEANGGRIEVESVRGKGTTFSVFLPT